MKILLLLNICNVSFIITNVLNVLTFEIAIDQEEATVKVTPPSLVINNATGHETTFSKRPSISSLWRHSIFHVSNSKCICIDADFNHQGAFSISLSRAEETAFEEKFKYLIVTSPLLNETLSVHHNKSKMINTTELPFQSTRTAKLGVTTNLVATLAILLGAEKYIFRPKVPIISLFFSTSASLFFLFRHKVSCQIAPITHNLIIIISAVLLSGNCTK
jgi:hypothetical protein